MDPKFQKIIDGQMICWPGLNGDMDGFVDNCSRGGLFWLEDGIEPWERDMAFDEPLFRSLFEFMRPELNAFQLASLAKWDAIWEEFRVRGVFHQRVKEEAGARFTWPDYRRHSEERLGRPIPKSHWWFWPPDEKK